MLCATCVRSMHVNLPVWTTSLTVSSRVWYPSRDHRSSRMSSLGFHGAHGAHGAHGSHGRDVEDREATDGRPTSGVLVAAMRCEGGETRSRPCHLWRP